MSNIVKKEIILNGICASPGICIGKAYLYDNEGVEIIDKYFIQKKKLSDEIKRFKTAIQKSKDELSTIIENTANEHSYVLETHRVLLNDKKLYDKTIETIEIESVNAEWALKKTISTIKSMFQKMSDPYLKERVSDIVHTCTRVMRHLLGSKKVNIEDISKRVILVACDLSPAETSQIQLNRVKGFITDHGGRTSHTSIIARTFEIPAVVGLDNATTIINNDDQIIVDGTKGKVIINPSDETIDKYNEQQKKYNSYTDNIKRNTHLLAKTKDGMQINVMGNIEFSKEASSVLDRKGDGIGLYRTEFQYLSRNGCPHEDELFENYKEVVELMAPNPVTIRTLDINGDKALANTDSHPENNPALGLRAIRYCLKKPDIFKTQLRAILRASAFGNVKILFPMISCYEEIIETKKIILEVQKSLNKKGIAFNRDIELGIMVEVPSVVVIADIMAKEVDFFSIGTNDLIQYSLAIDRENKQVAHLFNPLHPAVIRMIKHVTRVAKQHNIKVSMCGEMAGELMYLPILLGLNIDELSMSPQYIPIIKNAIRLFTFQEVQMFMSEVFKQDSVTDILKLLYNTYGDIIETKNCND